MATGLLYQVNEVLQQMPDLCRLMGLEAHTTSYKDQKNHASSHLIAYNTVLWQTGAISVVMTIHFQTHLHGDLLLNRQSWSLGPPPYGQAERGRGPHQQ